MKLTKTQKAHLVSQLNNLYAEKHSNRGSIMSDDHVCPRCGHDEFYVIGTEKS